LWWELSIEFIKKRNRQNNKELIQQSSNVNDISEIDAMTVRELSESEEALRKHLSIYSNKVILPSTFLKIMEGSKEFTQIQNENEEELTINILNAFGMDIKDSINTLIELDEPQPEPLDNVVKSFEIL